METGLVLRIPQAEPFVAAWRDKYDPAAARGMPAHITVLYPFMPFENIDEAMQADIDEIFARYDPIDLAFRRIARFPDTLWLAPEPAEPIIAMTQALMARFPDYPIYGGMFENITPHLTVAQGSNALLDDVETDLTGKLEKPFHVRVESCTLYAFTADGWRIRHEFAFGHRI